MITVGNYPDLATAQLAKSVLLGAAIESLIPDEFLAGVDWRMGTALHGIRLQVGPADAAAARLLLEEALGEGPRLREIDAESAHRACAACGSDLVGPLKWKQRLKAIALLFPFALLAWPVLAAVNPRFRCSACGQRWG